MVYDKDIQNLKQIKEEQIKRLKKVSMTLDDCNDRWDLLKKYKDIVNIRKEIEICDKKIELLRLARFRYLIEYKKYIEQ